MGGTAVKYCCCIDLDWIIARGGAKHMAAGTRLADGRRLTAAEWIARAAILKAKGLQALPTCDNHDSTGQCKGHPE